MLKADKPNQAALSDEEVLALALKTPSVFKVILDRYESAFLRKARDIIGAREEVDDVVVESFTKIYLKAGQFKKLPGASFKSWAYKILLNTSFSYYRRLKTRHAFTQQDTEFNWDMVAAKGGSREKEDLQDLIASVLVRLPKNLAQPLKLYFLDGWSQDEIAKREGLTRGAVKTRIHRAKKLFKAYLKELA